MNALFNRQWWWHLSFFFQLSIPSHPNIFYILSSFRTKHCLCQCLVLILNEYNLFMCGQYLWLIYSQKGLGLNRGLTPTADAGTIPMHSGHQSSASLLQEKTMLVLVWVLKFEMNISATLSRAHIWNFTAKLRSPFIIHNQIWYNWRDLQPKHWFCNANT